MTGDRKKEIVYSNEDGSVLVVQQGEEPSGPKYSSYETAEFFHVDENTTFWVLMNDDYESDIDANYILACELGALYKISRYFELEGQYSSRNKVDQYLADFYGMYLDSVTYVDA